MMEGHIADGFRGRSKVQGADLPAEDVGCWCGQHISRCCLSKHGTATYRQDIALPACHKYKGKARDKHEAHCPATAALRYLTAQLVTL